MASANKYFDEIGLSLSKDEAATLAAILAYVGGSPSRSPRGHADSISSALRDAGHHFTSGRAADIHKQISTFEHGSGIQFTDNKPEFVPGHYQNVNDDWLVEYFCQEPGENWNRVNVTPAD
jgi:hypothetical protein